MRCLTKITLLLHILSRMKVASIWLDTNCLRSINLRGRSQTPSMRCCLSDRSVDDQHCNSASCSQVKVQRKRWTIHRFVYCRDGFIPSMSFSLDHNVWFHEPDFRVDDWMLYETVSTKAGGSRAFIEGRLWTKDGRLVASTAQEALIRDKPPTSNQWSTSILVQNYHIRVSIKKFKNFHDDLVQNCSNKMSNQISNELQELRFAVSFHDINKLSNLLDE